MASAPSSAAPPRRPRPRSHRRVRWRSRPSRRRRRWRTSPAPVGRCVARGDLWGKLPVGLHVCLRAEQRLRHRTRAAAWHRCVWQRHGSRTETWQRSRHEAATWRSTAEAQQGHGRSVVRACGLQQRHGRASTCEVGRCGAERAQEGSQDCAVNQQVSGLGLCVRRPAISVGPQRGRHARTCPPPSGLAKCALPRLRWGSSGSPGGGPSGDPGPRGSPETARSLEQKGRSEARMPNFGAEVRTRTTIGGAGPRCTLSSVPGGITHTHHKRDCSKHRRPRKSNAGGITCRPSPARKCLSLSGFGSVGFHAKRSWSQACLVAVVDSAATHGFYSSGCRTWPRARERGAGRRTLSLSLCLSFVATSSGADRPSFPPQAPRPEHRASSYRAIPARPMLVQTLGGGEAALSVRQRLVLCVRGPLQHRGLQCEPSGMTESGRYGGWPA